jgi:glyoxylase-like metal-dependent hydrolase (beta-lactamase superfamily II)
MKLKDGVYAYPWMSEQVNNSSSYLFTGKVNLLVDPGLKFNAENLKEQMEEDGFDWKNINLIINTHLHPDHCEGNPVFKRKEVLLAYHQEEDKMYKSFGRQFFELFGLEPPVFQADFFLKDGDLILGEKNVQVYHTPGHSPGSICLYFPDTRCLVSGDLIFYGGVGRTDFSGGNGRLLKQSIERMETLDIECLLPGHGEILQGAKEIKENFRFIKRNYFGLL